ncbi:hypothetical protein Ddye_001169 [Dipteronia dyeriana]|uniref:Reverse transcriptase n=1 Tax=Dipteronia dyeriana TaxID=168575 RepID=A0AAD9XNE2_9ROSI|nr:hypothetical protein Ddye_001169 [Dipteronia dyeriana]
MFFANDSILFCNASKENNPSIEKILGIYECGSSQQINLAKSSITFILSVDVIKRFEIQQLLDIEDSNCKDRYLGLPSMVGGNKKCLFNDIKEKVWKKIRGWNGNMVSFGGKEVLIKAVVQAVVQAVPTPCKDRWILGPNSFLPITADTGSNIKVADFIDNSLRRWDIGKLDEVILQMGKDVILSIPINRRQCNDFLLWHVDKSGDNQFLLGSIMRLMMLKACSEDTVDTGITSTSRARCDRIGYLYV